MAISSETKRENAAAARAVKPTTVTTQTPVVTPKPKPAPIPAPRTQAQISADYKKISEILGTMQTNLPKIQSNLAAFAANSGVTLDSSGNVVTVTVLSSSYSGIGKDRTRTDRMSDGSTRTFSDPDPTYQEPVTGTTNLQVIKSTLKGRGLPATLVDDSMAFLTALQKEGLDEEGIVEIYLNNKDYTTKAGTTITSPFYAKYGFFNDKVTDPYSAKDLFQTVEGYKATATKYALDTKFTSNDYIQSYLTNKVSVKAFDENANTARLLAITSDPNRIKALTDLGYISGAQNLTDFYLDQTIGTEQMKQRVNTAAVAIEAVRRSNAATGIVVNTDNIKKYGAELTAKGLSENEIAALASKGYENIAASLAPATKLSGIYEGTNAAKTSTIQAELEEEQFRGIEKERFKRLSEQEQMSFRRQSGLTGQSLRTTPISGQY
jgi:hypothetical protein